MRIDYAVWKILANPVAFKVLWPIAGGRRPQLSRLSEYGGFPSGHTAFITGVTAVDLTIQATRLLLGKNGRQ